MTRDVVGDKAAVGTKAFTAAVLANFGKKPTGQGERAYRPLKVPRVASAPVPPKQRGIIGVDVFTESTLSANEVGKKMEAAAVGTSFKLKMISNRGTKVYPPTGAETDCVDHWRCRFLMQPGDEAQCTAQVTQLLRQVEQAGLRWMHVEKLPEFDSARGYTMAQGED